MQEPLGAVQEEVKQLFSSAESAHDFDHVMRVYHNALYIQKKEGGNKVVIGAAALLHDLHHLTEKKLGRYVHDEETGEMVEEVLEKVHFPKELLEQVKHTIATKKSRVFSIQGKQEQTTEAKILSDADELDALGAIGIARCFSVGGKRNRPLYFSGEDLSDRPYDNDNSKHDSSTLRHFYDKLLKLKDNMKTSTGKQLAEERHVFMMEFVKRFLEEWELK